MRIAFIDPPGINKGLNLGLGILAAIMQRLGHQIRVVDLNNNGRDIKKRIARINSYDFIGISIKSFTLKNSLDIAKHTGRKDLICGGSHVTLDGRNLLKDNPNLKIGFVGEAEETLPELIQCMKDGLNPEDIKGIIYRGDNSRGAILETSCRELSPDINAFPEPDYSCFDSVADEIGDYPLLTSRGCPYSCIYCCVGKISGKKMRFRSLEKVIAELEHVKTRYNSGSFQILDDNFTIDVRRAKEFCRGLIKCRLDMQWSCPNGLRADSIDEELVLLMKKSGCRQVSIGIESLDEEVFRNIKKGEDLADVITAAGMFKKHRIKVTGFFLIGLPYDSLLRSRASLKKACGLGLDTAHWNLFVPYPGTDCWNWVNEKTRIIRDWKEGFHFGPNLKPTFETDEFLGKEMVYMYNLANIRSRNYSAFFDGNKTLLMNAINMLKMVIKYDIWHLFGHINYVLSNLRVIKDYRNYRQPRAS